MTVKIQGNGKIVSEVDGVAFRAQRVVAKPIDYTTAGHYLDTAVTGVITAGATPPAEFYQFRWTSSSVIAIINRIRISVSTASSTFFPAGVPLQLAIYKSTSWTVSGTGGTTLTVDGTAKLRTSMASSAVGDFRIATTAALGAGTKTLEANPFTTLVASCPLASSTSGQIVAPGTVMMEANTANGAHPMILAQNEGFSLSLLAIPATASWIFSLEVLWAEATQY